MTLSAHRALALVVGAALLILPFLLQAGAFATVSGVVAGALLVTLELSADRDGRGLAGIGHQAADRLLAAGLGVLALVLAVLGEGGLAVCCAAGALALIALSLGTRYSVRPGRDDESRATTVATG
jgi:hypothetical protein